MRTAREGESPVGDNLRRDFQASLFATAGQDVVAIDDMLQEAEAAGLHVVDVKIADETIDVKRSDGTVMTHPAAVGVCNVVFVQNRDGYCIGVIGGPRKFYHEHGTSCFRGFEVRP